MAKTQSFANLCRQASPRAFAGQQPVAGAPWLFLHIPKTAGSAIREAFYQTIPGTCEVDKPMPKAADITPPDPGARIRDFMADGGHDRAPVILSHCEVRLWQPMLPRLPHARLVTFLRHPVDRMVSDYRYQCTPAHPLHETFRAKFPHFLDYAHDKRFHNRMYRHLSMVPNEPVQTIIDRLDHEFLFVGTQESYALSLGVLMALMGHPGAIEAQVVNRTVSTAPKVDPSASERDEIARQNGLDLDLYRHVQARLDHASDALTDAVTEAIAAQVNTDSGRLRRLWARLRAGSN